MRQNEKGRIASDAPPMGNTHTKEDVSIRPNTKYRGFDS